MVCKSVYYLARLMQAGRSTGVVSKEALVTFVLAFVGIHFTIQLNSVSKQFKDDILDHFKVKTSHEINISSIFY